MYTVVETPLFQKLVVDVWAVDERTEFINFISANPLVGDVMIGGKGLRKVRWNRTGIGKSGGARVIYFNRLERGDIVLLWVYTKSKFDNVRPEFMVALKERFNDY